MGIHGIYKEIGPGRRIALSKVAVEHFEKTGRPLRIAIDISIWLFQIQSSKGGSNPALRTFYYRLLRLISLSIHPLFVFDGPNKPPFKRNKRTGPNVASVPEFLAKQLLKQFGLPFHLAPGEAEAECALLQREGVVDAVLSEDVDTLMFGSGLTFRNWTPEANKSKVPTHVNLYDACTTKDISGMDREGMILVALMSGGDYVPEGIPGCGPKTACEAARAGFGHELCQISRRDVDRLRDWKERLAHELHTNENKFFSRKHGKLAIPDDFPNPEVLGYYTHPVVSSMDKIRKLEAELKWDMDIDFRKLRSFTADAFDWTNLSGAKKFIRNLAPALLVRELRMKGEALARSLHEPAKPTTNEEPYIKAIHGRRNHVSADHVAELRITFTPHELVPIDLAVEEPDDEISNESSDEEGRTGYGDREAPGSPTKKKAPSRYDPTEVEKLWVLESYVRAGAPLTVREWERSRKESISAECKNTTREARRTARQKNKNSASIGDTREGALDRFATVMSTPTPTKSPRSTSQLARSSKEPRRTRASKNKAPSTSIQHFTKVLKPGVSSNIPENSSDRPSPRALGHRWLGNGKLAIFPLEEPCLPDDEIEVVNLISTPQPYRSVSNGLSHDLPDFVPSPGAKRGLSPLRGLPTDVMASSAQMENERSETTMKNLFQSNSESPISLPSPSQLLPVSKRPKLPNTRSIHVNDQDARTTPRRHKKKDAIILSSSPIRQASIYDYYSPRRRDVQSPSKMISDEGGSQLPMSTIATRRVGHRCPRLDITDMIDHVDLTGTPADVTIQDLTKMPELDVATEPVLQALQQHEVDDSPTSLGQLSSKDSSSVSSLACLTDEVRLSRANIQEKHLQSVYRVRESLPGSFAIDTIDMTNDIGTINVSLPKMGRRFRMSEVSVLDLTGE
ncbi:uncharacterized protein PV09_04738 [Verruconis gallopava]|uniref:XPG-I domain-containing protein n=1 Tax=Verruconis gallopava TaxID=253628 RepID=A0A0D2ABF6_9PEZI|nr:uncharacterized protein PV09_04738 [Verruconis gallopava]KIW03895.1 hypothetical protein PV09_04738 [Verruconis gallopava]